MKKGQPLIVYALLQIPGLAAFAAVVMLLRPVFDLATWQVAGLIALWFLKDALLYPLVWRAYDWRRRNDAHVLVGSQGVVEKTLDPDGYIRVHGELWKAETIRKDAVAEKGAIVSIREIRGLVLLVE